MQFEEAQTQDLIDSKIMEHLAKAGAGPGQVSTSQHSQLIDSHLCSCTSISKLAATKLHWAECALPFLLPEIEDSLVPFYQQQ